MDENRRLKNYKPTAFKAPSSVYKEGFADAAVLFINSLRHTIGRWSGEPFRLIDWQERLIRDIFGIVRKHDECRQFRQAYIEIPKKQGKSELAAAVALLLTCLDREKRGEIYSCASDRQQASIVFDVAVDMVDQFPELKRRFKYMVNQKKLIYKPLGSFYQVLSADAYNKHGLNPHGIIFDELHALPDRRLFDVMTKHSTASREQPLTFIITTAGVDRNSVCWEMHQKAADILEGRVKNPIFYPVIYAAADDDDWESEDVWRRVNPSLGITVTLESMRYDYQDAKVNLNNENIFRQLRLNQWVKQTVRWMPMDKWDDCDFHFDPKALEGRECYGGLDLSATTDVTAFVLVFPPLDEADKYIVLPFFWIPEDTMGTRVKRDHVPYDQWRRDGFINATEGNVIHYAYVEKFIDNLGKKYKIKEIAFDAWGAWHVTENLQGLGFTVVETNQNFKSLSPPTKELMRVVLEKQLAHGGNPVLRWMADNLVVSTDPAGNVKPNKEKATQRIDGMVALIMALDRAIRHGYKKGVYEKRGMLIISDKHPRGYFYTSDADAQNYL